jgi:hypothetical protein
MCVQPVPRLRQGVLIALRKLPIAVARNTLRWTRGMYHCLMDDLECESRGLVACGQPLTMGGKNTHSF